MKPSGEPFEFSDPSPPHSPSGPVPDLELPDAPDFISRRSPIPLERMLPLLEQYRQCFPPTEAERQRRLQRKCTAEFVLQ